MRHYTDTVQTPGPTGALFPIAGASVTVYITNTLSLATIYSDEGITPKTNPVTTDLQGRFDFYVADGRYDLTVTGTNITTITQSNIEIADVTHAQVSDLPWQTELVDFVNQGSSPATPPTGQVSLYTKSDKNLYIKNDAGTEINLVGGASILPLNNTFTGTNQFNQTVTFKGPDPYVDIRAYGARAVSSGTGITTTCTNGLNTFTLSGASIFQNGDGVVIYGCGAIQSMATPSAPAVAPSVATANTGAFTGAQYGGTAGSYVTASPAGSTTYNYQIVAQDANGGLTAASTVGTTAIGQASLGSQNVNITSAVFNPGTGAITVTTASAHTLSAGAMVSISGNNLAVGFWNVATVPDNTHFTFAFAGFKTGGGGTVTGGTVTWFNCNHLTWSSVTGALKYYIYGRTGGSLTLLGVSRIEGGATAPGNYWDDYGSPMMDGPNLPVWVPTTPPVSATSDHLVTTITAGGGTTSITTAATAGTNKSGAIFRFDNAPAFLAAATAAGNSSMLYVPTGTFEINSFLNLSGVNFAMQQTGTLTLNDTIKLRSSAGWYGDRFPNALTNGGQFAWQGSGLAPINVAAAHPGVWCPGCASSIFRGLQFSSGSNASEMFLWDGGLQVSFIDVAFLANNPNDYMSIGLNMRSPQDGGFAVMDRIQVVGPQGKSTTTPMLMFDFLGMESKFTSFSMSGRGMFFTTSAVGGPIVTLDHGRIQAAEMPVISIGTNVVNGNGIVEISNYVTDTGAVPILYQAGTPNGLSGGASSLQIGNFVSTPYTSGFPLSLLGVIGASSGFVLTAGQTSTGFQSTTNGGIAAYPVNNPAIITGFAGVGVGLVQMAAPTVVAGGSGSCASNCVAAGTHTYQTQAVDINGGVSPPSLSTSVTVDGTMTVTISWVLQNGQYRTAVARDGTWGYAAGNGISVASMCSGTSVLDHATGSCAVGPGYTNSLITASTGVGIGASPQGLSAHQTTLIDPATTNSLVWLAPKLFAGLGTPANGTFTYCSDCTIANPCAGSGTGALAKRLNGIWVCN